MIVNNSKPISTTNKKECLNNDCQQFLQYQQKNKNLNNESTIHEFKQCLNNCQQFLQYQQTKKNV